MCRSLYVAVGQLRIAAFMPEHHPGTEDSNSAMENPIEIQDFTVDWNGPEDGNDQILDGFRMTSFLRAKLPQSFTKDSRNGKAMDPTKWMG